MPNGGSCTGFGWPIAERRLTVQQYYYSSGNSPLWEMTQLPSHSSLSIGTELGPVRPVHDGFGSSQPMEIRSTALENLEVFVQLCYRFGSCVSVTSVDFSTLNSVAGVSPPSLSRYASLFLRVCVCASSDLPAGW